MTRSPSAAKALEFTLILTGAGATAAPVRKAAVTGNSRVDNLLNQTTLDPNIATIHCTDEPAASYQGEAGYLPGIPRLGIPPMRFADGCPEISRAAGRVPFEMGRIGFFDGKNKLEVTSSDISEDVKIIEKTSIDADPTCDTRNRVPRKAAIALTLNPDNTQPWCK
jgi:hypothetical protein